MTRHLATLRES
ncbi:hypothetical protein ACTFIT_005017 [Dictyostelium discoideum]